MFSNDFSYFIGMHEHGYSLHMVYHTGKPIEVIEKDTDRDFFLSAEESVEYGLIDKIIKAKEGVVKVK
jgi:ATP-dependent protease ClpP protease subunit